MKKVFRNVLIWFYYLFIKLLYKRKENIFYKSILILVPHPDDEVFGLGGFILKMSDHGSKIHIIYLTDGEGSGIWHDGDKIKIHRIALSENVCMRLGIINTDIYRLEMYDGYVPQHGQAGFDNVVIRVKVIIESVKPDAVFTTHLLDYWPFDHVAAAQIAKEAVIQSDTKPELWYYWVWAWYNLKPWQILGRKRKKLQKIDISDQLERKYELTDIYLNSLTPDGKPWIGILPDPLLRAFKYPYEIVERIL